jgi:hypothetical protein
MRTVIGLISGAALLAISFWIASNVDGYADSFFKGWMAFTSLMCLVASLVIWFFTVISFWD